jgi:hypothetical protein
MQRKPPLQIALVFTTADPGPCDAPRISQINNLRRENSPQRHRIGEVGLTPHLVSMLREISPRYDHEFERMLKEVFDSSSAVICIG